MTVISGALLAFACCGSILPHCFAAGQTGRAFAQLEILDQTRGEGSGYRERPRCFIIRSLPELQIFWEKHAPDEPMPNVNFEKRMLFLWVPGPSLHGYRAMRAIRLIRKPRGHLLELEIQRSDNAGAGSWRSPWLMALLPRFRGDIEVVRRGDADEGEAEQMPLAVIHDMGIERGESSIAAVSSGAGKAKPRQDSAEDIFGTAGGAGSPVTAVGKTAMQPDVPQPAKAGVQSETASFEQAPPTEVMEPGSGKAAPPAKTDAAPKSPPSAGTASSEADPFGDAFNLDF